MIIMTADQIEKLRLLDTLFGSLSLSELTQFVESEQVVAKLKGTEENPELFFRLMRDQDVNNLEIMNLKAELASLKGDFQTLMKILNMTTFSYSSDWNSLKQKHNVY